MQLSGLVSPTQNPISAHHQLPSINFHLHHSFKMETPTPSTQTPKTVQWYQPTLTQLPEPTKDLFEKYAGLETEDEIKDHITSIRNKAWQM
jgi:hypothetical protein